MQLFIGLFVAGLLVGAVVNWLADQLPLQRIDADEEMDDVEPDERSDRHQLDGLHKPVCVHCGTPRHALAYTGLSAWLSGKRKCENCGRNMTIRYPIVELLLGAVYVYLYATFGPTEQFGAYLIYLTLYVLIGVIDIEYRYILNAVMIPAFIIALIELIFGGRLRPRDGFVGYAVGQLFVIGIYFLGAVYLWSINRGREKKIKEVAFGFGDVTLATFCGLIIGFPNVVYMLVLMILIGGGIALIYGIYYLVVARKYGGFVPIAYGPAIMLATTVMMMWPDAITSAIYTPR